MTAVANAQKTPVSLLFNMSLQYGWTPEYEITAVEGASHDPTFTYQVKVHDVVASASGQSKRKAKHSAAKIALEQLLARPEIAEKGFFFENVPVTVETLEEVVVEPVVSEPAPIGGDAKNSVGILQEFCMKNKDLPPPYYETVHESGPPHDKTFVVQCMVGLRVTEGEGKTKKIGKRIAAELMVQILYTEFPERKDKLKNESKPECDEDLVANLLSLCTSDSEVNQSFEENGVVLKDLNDETNHD